MNDEWTIINKDILSTKLYNNNGSEIFQKTYDNDSDIKKIVKMKMNMKKQKRKEKEAELGSNAKIFASGKILRTACEYSP